MLLLLMIGAGESSAYEKNCIKDISAVVLEVARTETPVLQEMLVKKVVELYYPFEPNDRCETLKRWVYDSIKILSGAGLILRFDKTIVFRNKTLLNANVVSENNQRLARIIKKKEVLQFKLKILTGYKAVIQENIANEKPKKAISLPCIIVGIRDKYAQTVSSIDRTRIVFQSQTIAQVYSLIEILDQKYNNDIFQFLLNRSPFKKKLSAMNIDECIASPGS